MDRDCSDRPPATVPSVRRSERHEARARILRYLRPPLSRERLAVLPDHLVVKVANAKLIALMCEW